MNRSNQLILTLIFFTLGVFALRELEHAKAVGEQPTYVTVFVSGEVLQPGTVTLPIGSRRIHAIEICGGMTLAADSSELQPALQLKDGETLTLPPVEPSLVMRSREPAPLKPAAIIVPTEKHESSPFSQAPVSQTRKEKWGEHVDINTADAITFTILPGVGPVLAERIVRARESTPTGTFTSIEDLAMIRGIKGKTMERLRPYLELEGL